MSVENDTLTLAAERFTEAIRAERSATVETLENERKAAIQIIEALRKENSKQSKLSTNTVILSLALGLAVGSAAVWWYLKEKDSETSLPSRFSLSANRASLTLKERFQAALNAGKSAATVREQELWGQYRNRLTNGN